MHSIKLDLLRGALTGTFSDVIQKLAANSEELQHLLDALVSIFRDRTNFNWATVWDIIQTAAHLITQLSSDPKLLAPGPIPTNPDRPRG